MFTGIIEETGVVHNIIKKGDTCRLILRLKEALKDIKVGDSIALNGACLTVVDSRGELISFDIMEETFKETTFSSCHRSDLVNIERAIKVGSRLNGHFVLGHIDKIGKIKSIRKTISPFIDIVVLSQDRKYIVNKGSIAIDGISLTVAEIARDSIRICLIPHTLENTNLKYKKALDLVNIEFDILGKYAVKNQVNA